MEKREERWGLFLLTFSNITRLCQEKTTRMLECRLQNHGNHCTAKNMGESEPSKDLRTERGREVDNRNGH